MLRDAAENKERNEKNSVVSWKVDINNMNSKNNSNFHYSAYQDEQVQNVAMSLKHEQKRSKYHNKKNLQK